jgi:hypothetical protein
MPIKEIIALSAAIMASIAITHPTHPMDAIRKVQAQILREVGRTDTWGNPSIFVKSKNRSWTVLRH